MPPLGLPRPDDKAYDSLAAYLEHSLDRAAAAKPDPGRTDSMRRLNRTEYHNAVRDLLAVDVDLSALIPPDDSGHGFDNITVGRAVSHAYGAVFGCGERRSSRLAVGSPRRTPEGENDSAPAGSNARRALSRAAIRDPRRRPDPVYVSAGRPSTKSSFGLPGIVTKMSKD